MCEPRLAVDRIIDYLEIAPKKCYFSLLNTFANNECMMVAMRHHETISLIINMWNFRKNENETIEEFRERVKKEHPELWN